MFAFVQEQILPRAMVISGSKSGPYTRVQTSYKNIPNLTVTIVNCC